jgi:phenylacetate-CoA ligase
MITLLNKIELGLNTCREARKAVRRQYDLGEIRRIQIMKLQRLLHYCTDKVKYYKEIFQQAGIDPNKITTLDDLESIPILTKKELRNRFWDFLPSRLPECRVTRTSGSTGIPVCFLSDRTARMFNSAAVIRSRKAAGIPLISRPILTPLKTEIDPPRKPHWTFLQGIHKTYYINPYLDSADNAEYAARLFMKLKRPAIIGITPAIRALAQNIQDGFFPSLRPSAVLTTGETLRPKVRSLLESTFQTKVRDIYGCSEGGEIAWQCHRGCGYHINADNCIVEIVKGNKPVANGETGEVVITNLNRYAMPVIRYKNGDLAKLSVETCSCGCKLPMIEEIAGRSGEDMSLPNGKTIPWNQLKSLMTHQCIRQFQLVQDKDGSLMIKYISENGVDTEQLDALLLYRFRRLLGDTIEIKIKKTTTIHPAASGKSKLVVSLYRARQ